MIVTDQAKRMLLDQSAKIADCLLLEFATRHRQNRQVSVHKHGLGSALSCVVLSLWLLFGCRGKGIQQPIVAEAGSPSSALTPRIAIDPPEYHFGNVIVGDSVAHSFSVKDTGASTLIITDIEETCNCTIGTLKDRQIAPGCATTLEVRYRPNGITGPERQTLTLHTNDPYHSEATLTVLANVASDMKFEPETIRLVSDDPTKRKQIAELTGRVVARAHLSLGKFVEIRLRSRT